MSRVTFVCLINTVALIVLYKTAPTMGVRKYYWKKEDKHMSNYELLQESPGLFVLTIIISLIVTLIAYSAFPLIFSRTRKSNITKKKYYTLCYCINFAVMVLFIAINGEPSSGGPYLLWTWVFSSSGLKTLKGRGVLGEGQIVSCSTSTSNEEPIVAETPIVGEHPNYNICQNCGHELIDGASFCNMCGAKVPSVVLMNNTEPINNAVNDKICFCRKCGNKLQEDAKFCNKCGTQIITEE